MTNDRRGDSCRDLAAAGGSRPFGYNGTDRNDGGVREVIIGVGNGQFYLDVWDWDRSSPPSPGSVHGLYSECLPVACHTRTGISQMVT